MYCSYYVCYFSHSHPVPLVAVPFLTTPGTVQVLKSGEVVRVPAAGWFSHVPTHKPQGAVGVKPVSIEIEGWNITVLLLILSAHARSESYCSVYVSTLICRLTLESQKRDTNRFINPRRACAVLVC